MQVNGNKVEFGSTTIKAKSGEYGNGQLKFDALNNKLYIGTLEFPVVPLNKLTFNEDGLLLNSSNKLMVSNNNLWHTANVVGITVEPNTEASQAAVFTIQHGDASSIITNLNPQEVLLPHTDGVPLLVTATNYSTGAVGTVTLNPVPGQRYKLQSTSIVRQEGELKNICVREEYDVYQAPVIGQEVFTHTYAKEINRRGSSYQEAVDMSIQDLTSLESSMADGYMVDWRENMVMVAVNNTHYYIENQDTKEQIVVIPDVPLKVPPGTYKLCKGQSVDNTGRYAATSVAYVSYVPIMENTFTIAEEMTVLITINLRVYETKSRRIISTSSYAKVSGNLEFTSIIRGPLTPYCATWQTIDTRQEFPEISLAVEELN